MSLTSLDPTAVFAQLPDGQPPLNSFPQNFKWLPRMERPVVSFGIYREDGLYLGLASTETAGFHTGKLRGTGEFRFQWECPFNAGGYRITATVADSTGKTVLAQAHSAAAFEVLQRPGFDHGAVRLDGHWSTG